MSKDNKRKTRAEVTKLYNDSSDEETIESRNQKYDLNNSGIDFDDLAKELEVDRNSVIKSVLLHNIGRMVIYSPKIEKKYREYKDNLLSERRSLKLVDENIKVQDLGVEVQGLEDIVAVGRLLRRSQIRVYKNIFGYNEEKRVTAEVKISSKRQKTSSVVREDLVVNYSGLGGGKNYPNTDMVDLNGESKKGDYTSAYSDNEGNYGEVAVSQFIEASQKVAKEGESSDLDSAINTISELREEIQKHYPEVNSDIFIAESIRKVCRSEPLLEISTDGNVVNKIYALAYLLFKTEVYRSPAALVNHIQMLDLIINGEMSLREAFEGQKMPMSPKNSIRAARELGAIYNNGELFYKYENTYKYHPGYSSPLKPGSLVLKEVELMDRWLMLKFGEEKFKAMSDDLEWHIPEISEEIYGALQGFGLNIHSPAFVKAMQPLPRRIRDIGASESKQSGEVRENYTDDLVDKIIASHCQKFQNCERSGVAQSVTKELMLDSLSSFRDNKAVPTMIAPIHSHDHYSILYITKNEEHDEQNGYKIIYIDPKGSDEPIPDHVLKAIQEIFPDQAISISRSKIQISKEFESNNYCGAYICALSEALLNDCLRVNKDGQILLRYGSDTDNWNPVTDLNSDSSIELGKQLFKAHELGEKTTMDILIRSIVNNRFNMTEIGDVLSETQNNSPNTNTSPKEGNQISQVGREKQK